MIRSSTGCSIAARWPPLSAKPPNTDAQTITYPMTSSMRNFPRGRYALTRVALGDFGRNAENLTGGAVAIDGSGCGGQWLRQRALLAGARWNVAQAAYVMARQVVVAHDIFAVAAGARRDAQHLGVDEAYEAPCAGDRQHDLHLERAALLEVELVGLHQRVDVVELADLDQVVVDAHEQRLSLIH